MKQVTDNRENIKADINALVDRISCYDVYNVAWGWIRKQSSYEIKDLLTEIVNVQDSVSSGNHDDFVVFITLITKLCKLKRMTKRNKGLDCGPDPYDVPMTEEELERACYINAMIEQTKRYRKEWESAQLSFSGEGRTVGSINNTEGDLK